MPYRLRSIKKILSYGLIIVFTALIVSACLDNFNRDLDTIYYNPSYSVPIGPVSHSMADIMPYLALPWPIPDTFVMPDTADFPILIYDDTLFFRNPEEGYDTIFFEPFDMQAIVEQSEYIVSVMFRANILNGLPVNTATQIYYIDGAGQTTDSLYDNGSANIQSALVNERDSVLAPYFTTIDTYLDEMEIQNLVQASQLGIYIYLQTLQPNDDTLRIYSDQLFNVQLAVRVELLIPLE